MNFKNSKLVNLLIIYSNESKIKICNLLAMALALMGFIILWDMSENLQSLGSFFAGLSGSIAMFILAYIVWPKENKWQVVKEKFRSKF